jgi:hypothetical protein
MGRIHGNFCVHRAGEHLKTNGKANGGADGNCDLCRRLVARGRLVAGREGQRHQLRLVPELGNEHDAAAEPERRLEVGHRAMGPLSATLDRRRGEETTRPG